MLAPLLDGLTFTEGPRWHDGRLWFSDFYTHRVLAVTPEGKAETVLEVAQRPSGLGWLPDGSLLVVSMLDRRLLRARDGRAAPHAARSCASSQRTNARPYPIGAPSSLPTTRIESAASPGVCPVVPWK